jgi:hypothetical protein
MEDRIFRLLFKEKGKTDADLLSFLGTYILYVLQNAVFFKTDNISGVFKTVY